MGASTSEPGAENRLSQPGTDHEESSEQTGVSEQNGSSEVEAESLNSSRIESDNTLIPIQIMTQHRRGGFVTFMYLTNTLLGPGIVAVSSTFKTTGIGPTIIIAIAAALLCYISSSLFISIHHKLEVNTLNELADKTFGGKAARVILSILCLFFDLTLASTNLVIGTDQVKSWLSLTGLNLLGFKKWCLILFLYTLVIPSMLTIPRHFEFLDGFQKLTVFGIVLYAVIITIKGFTVGSLPAETVIGYCFDMSAFTSFAVHVSSFCLPIHLIPLIVHYNPKKIRRKVISGISLIFDFIVIVTPGVVGYLTYGSDVKSDVLNSYPSNDALMIFVRVIIFSLVTFTYPLLVNSITGILGEMLLNQPDPAEMTLVQRLVLIPIVNIVSFLLALISSDLQSTLGLGGAITGCLVAFAFPAFCMLKFTSKKWYHYKKILYFLFCVFGIIVGGISTYTSIADKISCYKNGLHEY